jgi:hypothetical protein
MENKSMMNIKKRRYGYVINLLSRVVNPFCEITVAKYVW